MRSLRLCLLLTVIVTAAAATAFATTYEVGPGKTYTNIGDVPWESIGAGDTVLIYYRATPYKEKWVICAQGTEASPITVSGVAGGGGELPVIDGDGATTRTQLDYWNEKRGVIKIGGANTPPDTTPQWIVIENLDMKSARSAYSFTNTSGRSAKYEKIAAPLYVEKAQHLKVINCIIRDGGNGIMVSSSDTLASSDILIEGCLIYDNGNTNSLYEHNNYTAALGIIHQYNHMGPLRTGCTGNNLKDRSAGQVVRYNWIEGGNRQLDLIDAEDSIIIRQDPSYLKTHVYGNILIELDDATNRQIIHYGGDSGVTENYRKGKLYLYNNTIVSYKTGRNTLMNLSTNDETCDARNNIYYCTSADSSLIDDTGILDMTNNYLTSGWINSYTPGYTGTVNDNGGNISGTSPGFVNESSQDFHLVVGSDCVDAGTTLHADVLPDHNVTLQYVEHQGYESRPSDATFDIGAFENAGGPPPDLTITTTSLPDGTVDVAYSQTLAATGGVTPYTWTLFSGSLPAGLTLSSGGVVSGTPTTEETANFTVQVEDSDSPTSTDTQALSITINAAGEPPTITTTSLPDGNKNVPYSAFVVVTGGTTPYTWTKVSGKFPNGLSLNASTGEISGTPHKTGTENFTVRCTDDVGLWDEQALSITINP